jgi:uncharacterized protein (TIGR00730 family)
MTKLSSSLDHSDRSYDVKDKHKHELIEQFVKELEPYAHTDLLREVLVTTVKLAEQNAARGDLKILRAAAKELRYAFKVFDKYRDTPKVAIFGSARSKEAHPDYATTREFASCIAKKGYMVITGAGGGIMAAGNEGAGREMSIGLNILLPFEQVANDSILGDPKLINFHYFFTRKLFFIKESDAVVLMPGGFGTMDEGFEALTLVQTGKDSPAPIVMLERPGGTYWPSWRDFIRKNLVERGLVSRDDEALYYATDSVEDACEEIEKFYRRYHSCRYVQGKTKLVLRLKTPLAEGQLGKLNDRFSDILKEGLIETCEPFAEEYDETDLLHLPRLSLTFDQRHFSRLRQLIDEINE